MRDARFALVAMGLLVGSLAWATADNAVPTDSKPTADGKVPADSKGAADRKPPALKKPAAAPVKPIVETLFGRKITDNYRYMEALDPATIEWMKSQGAYARSLLDSIKPLAHLKTEIAKFSASFGLIQGYVHFGTRGFYEERAPGSDNFDLMVTDGAGIRKLVDVAALRAANGGKPFAINYFLASPDGNKVAVGISEGGSEDASITVYDAASGAKMGGPIDRAQFGATSWSDDSKLLYFVRLQKTAVNAPASDKYLNATADAWDLKSEPVAILGASLGHGPALTPVEAPAIAISVGAPVAAALSINGVQNELAMWLAPAARVSDPKVTWTKFLTREDEITNVDMRGAEIFLLSHKDAPTFKVLTVQAGQPLSSAATLVPAQADRVIEGVHAAADALYLLGRHGVYSQLLRIPAGRLPLRKCSCPSGATSTKPSPIRARPVSRSIFPALRRRPRSSCTNPPLRVSANLRSAHTAISRRRTTRSAICRQSSRWDFGAIIAGAAEERQRCADHRHRSVRLLRHLGSRRFQHSPCGRRCARASLMACATCVAAVSWASSGGSAARMRTSTTPGVISSHAAST